MDLTFAMSAAPNTHPAILAYAEKLDGALVGEVSAGERMLLVEEALFVLERLADEHLLTGVNPDEAARRAVEEYGEPALLASTHVEGHFESAPSTPMVRRLGRANSLAFGLFGCGTLAYLVLLQLRVYLPSGAPLKLPFTPAEVRSIFPEPLPFPEFSLSFFLTVGYPLLAPVLLGALVGRRIPVRAASAVARALQPSILAAFLAGSLLLPNTEGLLFAVFQVVFWFPVGCLSAHVASSLARRKRARQALKGAAATTPEMQNR